MDHKFKDFICIFALIMKRISLIAILAATMFAGCSRLDGEYTLHILSTNDVHGAWFDTPYVDGAVRPSLMAVNTYVDSIRKAASRDNVLLIDAGDCLQEGRFSGAVTANQADDLALIYFQADSLQGMDRAVISMQILNL